MSEVPSRCRRKEPGRVNQATVPGEHAPGSATAPDGRTLAAITIGPPGQQAPTETQLVTIDPDTGTTELIHRYDGPPTPAAWDRAGRYIVTADGPDLTVLDPTDGATHTVHDAIPDDHYLIATG